MRDGYFMTTSVNSLVTIVMYHYVRPISKSRYPFIRGLELHEFEGQLDYIERNYTVISAAELVRGVRTGKPLPDNALLLTFDDGYIDHFQFVAPALQRRGMSGLFFPTSGTVEERQLLDVNKVHFLLSSIKDIKTIVRSLEDFIEASRDEFDLPPLVDFRDRLWFANRFDPPEVIYVKRMLQFALPQLLRSRIASYLFSKYVSRDEATFADELYVSIDQLQSMYERGMEIGSHGHGHHWLNSLSVNDQALDIDRSLQMLDLVGIPRKDFYFCYPFGGYTEDTVKILAERDCSAAFTTRAVIASLANDEILELPRLDTNDLPKYSH